MDNRSSGAIFSQHAAEVPFEAVVSKNLHHDVGCGFITMIDGQPASAVLSSRRETGTFSSAARLFVLNWLNRTRNRSVVFVPGSTSVRLFNSIG